MNKSVIIEIVDKYLSIFPEEKDRQKHFINYLNATNEKAICDWNNAVGHITAGGFVYSSSTQRFLVMWHKDLGMFLYPGGHMEAGDNSPLERAKLEAKEETGLELENLKIFDNELIPLDIDTHVIDYNPRVGMPKHFHFDFRYVFVAQNESGVELDKTELSSYKWIDKTELKKDVNYGNIIKKLDKYLK